MSEGQKWYQKLKLSLQPKNLFQAISVLLWERAQLAITCSKLTVETLEQGMKYVQR